MPSLDVFDLNAFTLLSMTARINKMDYTPGRAKTFFPEQGVETTTIMVEERGGTLELVPTSPRGAPPATRGMDKRTARSLVIPHLALTDTILADSVQNVRAFGTENQTETVQLKVDERAYKLARDIEGTKENLCLGALRGLILDADGSTIYNLFTEFGVSQLSEFDFELSDEDTDVRAKCMQLRRLMAIALGADSNAGFRIHAMCSDGFFDALIAHDSVKQTYLNWTAAADLRSNLTYQVFPFGGIDFENYRGTDDGSTILIEANKANFFPVIPDLYALYYAPADYVETVNTIGLPLYAKQAIDREFGKFVKIEVQSNPLPICKKPRSLMIATKDAGGTDMGA